MGQLLHGRGTYEYIADLFLSNFTKVDMYAGWMAIPDAWIPYNQEFNVL